MFIKVGDRVINENHIVSARFAEAQNTNGGSTTAIAEIMTTSGAVTLKNDEAKALLDYFYREDVAEVLTAQPEPEIKAQTKSKTAAKDKADKADEAQK